ncbi:MAG: lamin tail domain-containing protein, partial [Deltaproteobacteria bacterium]|nr:lamin tail domain-containing protein [Deltaproteobacteria bacterium]
TVADLQPAAGPGDTSPSNEFTVSATSGGPQLRVNDFFYRVPSPAVGDTFSLLRGVLQFRNGNSKLEPRGAADVQLPPRLAGLGPSGMFLSMGALEPTFPQALTVTLSSVQPADTVVTAQTSDPAVLDVGAGQVTVPAGQSSGLLLLRGVSPGTATVTATLGADSFTAPVRVLGSSDVPSTVTFSSSAVSAAPGGTATLTVQLDLPAPPGGTTVGLSSGPLGTVPAAVVVQERALTATVDFTAGAATGAETVTATLGSSTATATVDIQPSNIANHVVISELQTGGAGSGTTGDEFVELFNPTGADVAVGGWQLEYAAASTGAYNRVLCAFPAGTVLPARSFLLCASTGHPVAAGDAAPDFTWTTGLSQGSLGGGGGHVRLVTSAGGTVVDLLGWGTAIVPEGTATPAPGGGSSLERKAYGASTSASMASGGGDADSGNGTDTNDNAADFVVRSAPQPQNAASPAEP